MEFFSVMKARRSVRKFLREPVGRKVLERIISAGVEAPSGCNMQLRQYIIVDDPIVLAELAKVGGALAGAPAAIVLLVEPKASPGGEFWIQDISAAMENMLLAAVALGYASCWVEGQVRNHENCLREVLDVPKELRVWSIMPVGKADGQPAGPQKPSAAKITHYNRFGRGE